MCIWAIVPVKPFVLGKSRLANVLSSDIRCDMNRKFLTRTLETLKHIPQIEEVLVVSRDAAALKLARGAGVRTLQEKGKQNINEALQSAILLLHRYHVTTALIMPADLPLINVADVNTLLAMRRPAPSVVIIPDRHDEGTNGLLLSPPDVIPPAFGANSFQMHCRQARTVGANLQVCNLATLAFDLDYPEDLDLLNENLYAERIGFAYSRMTVPD
ncbi:MAG: 2-phospho-L-lactate guanylyltransferase [Anaerolineales bacterium]